MPVFYPNKKLPVTEIESPDDITADSPDGFYIQEGGTSTPSGGTTIHYYDSIEQVPADLPDGAFLAVPSEIPTFNLIEMGVPAITETQTATACDTEKLKKLRAALDVGCVKLIYDVITEGVTVSAIVCAIKTIGSALPDGHQILINGSLQGLGVVLTIIEVNDAGIQTRYVALTTA